MPRCVRLKSQQNQNTGSADPTPPHLFGAVQLLPLPCRELVGLRLREAVGNGQAAAPILSSSRCHRGGHRANKKSSACRPRDSIETKTSLVPQATCGRAHHKEDGTVRSQHERQRREVHFRKSELFFFLQGFELLSRLLLSPRGYDARFTPPVFIRASRACFKLLHTTLLRPGFATVNVNTLHPCRVLVSFLATDWRALPRGTIFVFIVGAQVAAPTKDGNLGSQTSEHKSA